MEYGLTHSFFVGSMCDLSMRVIVASRMSCVVFLLFLFHEEFRQYWYQFFSEYLIEYSTETIGFFLFFILGLETFDECLCLWIDYGTVVMIN